MSALPPDTRAALVQHYVDASPLAKIANELGVNASAVAMRLQRGKLALRRELSRQGCTMTSPRMDTLHPNRAQWVTTRLWCELCGHHRLLGKIEPDRGSIELHCPACCHECRRGLYPVASACATARCYQLQACPFSTCATGRALTTWRAPKQAALLVCTAENRCLSSVSNPARPQAGALGASLGGSAGASNVTVLPSFAPFVTPRVSACRMDSPVDT